METWFECDSCLHCSCSYRCDCEPGWVGKNCDLDRNDCLPSPCQNAGTCFDQLNGFICKCRQGFRGEIYVTLAQYAFYNNNNKKRFYYTLFYRKEQTVLSYLIQPLPLKRVWCFTNKALQLPLLQVHKNCTLLANSYILTAVSHPQVTYVR